MFVNRYLRYKALYNKTFNSDIVTVTETEVEFAVYNKALFIIIMKHFHSWTCQQINFVHKSHSNVHFCTIKWRDCFNQLVNEQEFVNRALGFRDPAGRHKLDSRVVRHHLFRRFLGLSLSERPSFHFGFSCATASPVWLSWGQQNPFWKTSGCCTNGSHTITGGSKYSTAAGYVFPPLQIRTGIWINYFWAVWFKLKTSNKIFQISQYSFWELHNVLILI